ncbi:MAG: septum formation protein Maf [Christensenellaceae bacterium]|nr:septum formation protein Maf [Christensenellaceae bacterium]
MLENDFGLILASSSPRRIELLKRLEVQFTVIPFTIDESHIDYVEGESPYEYSEALAISKCMDVANKYPNSFVIGADTTVELEGLGRLGKPKDEEDAFNILKSLSGKQHNVITGICIYSPITKKIKSDYDISLITFKTLSDDVIKKYIATGEPMDKAGAYAIQGIGKQLVSEHKGSLSNVVGFPLALVYMMLCDCGFMSSVRFIDI